MSGLTAANDPTYNFPFERTDFFSRLELQPMDTTKWWRIILR